jgi:hypothetical protein
MLQQLLCVQCYSVLLCTVFAIQTSSHVLATCAVCSLHTCLHYITCARSVTLVLVMCTQRSYGRHSLYTLIRTYHYDFCTKQILLQCQRRVKITGVQDFGPPLRVDVEHLPRGNSFDSESPVIKAYCHEVLASIRKVCKLNPMLTQSLQYFSQHLNVQVSCCTH